LHKEIPIKILDKISKIPGIASPQLKKTAKLGNFMNKKVKEMYELFEHFVTNEWIYES